MTPYVSIDIETTGLDPETCQILEIGAVWEDWTTPIEKLKTFRALIGHDEYRGQPYALAMNSKLLYELAGTSILLTPRRVVGHLCRWLAGCGWDGKSITPAGKNFGSFDLQFLKKLPGFDIPFRHRAIDPGMLYFQPWIDGAIPSTSQCYSRAGISEDVAHTAVADALGVVKLIRAYYESKKLENRILPETRSASSS